MKTKVLTVLCGALLVGAGCISTVNDRKTPGVPFVRDRFEGRYERPLEQVFQAAKEVVSAKGVLVNEATLYGQTNTVKTIEGRIDERKVWIRAESLDPKITAVTVEVRTSGGGADMDLAHEVEKEIALKLVR
jgi:hypothetical protein